jgi:hypothetical protein
MQMPRVAPSLPWALFMLVTALMPATAFAQQSPLSTWVGDSFSMVINHPTVAADGGRIDCAPGTSGCRPLNISRCNDASILPIEFIISPGARSLPTYTGNSQVLYAFLGTTAGCVYSTVSGQTGNNPNLLIGTTSSLAGSAPFFSGGTQTFRFPAGISTFNAGVTAAGRTQIFTVGELMNALGVCPPNAPVQMSTYFLCVGVDVHASQGINNTATNAQTTQAGTGTPGATNAGGSDPVAYLQFQIDTLPPDAPTITASRSLNGRVAVDVAYNSPSLDVYTIDVRYTKEPQNLTLACDQWTGDVRTTPSQNVYGQSSGNLTFMVEPLENNVDYAFCAQAVDYMENPSVPTPVSVAQPRFECDLFGCYPDALQTGFCAQTAAPQVWLMAAGAFGLRAVFRRRRQRTTP